MGDEVQIAFVSAVESPTGLPLLLVANENGEYLAVISIPEPASLSLLSVGAICLVRRRRQTNPTRSR